MEITYRIQTTDIFDFKMYCYRQFPNLRKQLFGIRIVLPMILLSILALYVVESGIPAFQLLWISVLIVTLYIITFPLLYRIALWISISITLWPSKNAKATLHFEERGVSIIMPERTTTFDWEIIRRIVQTKTCYFLFYAPTNAIVIPKHAFASPAEMDHVLAFIDECRIKIAEAPDV
ncbi:YcxB family protein [Chloroflexia bacterium SDU3-3]|nr:YcxB family protein [Chloroflexia bacterium SDU3-3]